MFLCFEHELRQHRAKDSRSDGAAQPSADERQHYSSLTGPHAQVAPERLFQVCCSCLLIWLGCLLRLQVESDVKGGESTGGMHGRVLQQQQTFKVWQPQRAARSNRPNTPSDGSNTMASRPPTQAVLIPRHVSRLKCLQQFIQIHGAEDGIIDPQRGP